VPAGPASQDKAVILTRAAANLTFLPSRRDEALALLREAISIARGSGVREIEAEALQFVGMIRLDAGEAEGVRDLETALAVATELNSPASLTCYGNLADMRRYMGALKESAALHLAGERAARRFGIPVQVRRFRGGQACDLYYSGEWDRALGRVAEYLDAVSAGSPHRMAGEAMLHRGRIRFARGEGDAARADARAALDFARRTGDPFDVFPALAFQVRAFAVTDPARAEACLTELCDALAHGQPLWGGWALGDVVPVVRGHPRAGDLARTLAAAAPRTPWYDALDASLRGEFERAAAMYAAIGSQPDAAFARLLAADRAFAGGDLRGCRAHLSAALGFFRRVGAHAHLRDAQALWRALPDEASDDERAADIRSPRSRG
jgi:tetratricopeptide (TPR) repeat protein